jgi:hypothetical protein
MTPASAALADDLGALAAGAAVAVDADAVTATADATAADTEAVFQAIGTTPLAAVGGPGSNPSSTPTSSGAVVPVVKGMLLLDYGRNQPMIEINHATTRRTFATSSTTL